MSQKILIVDDEAYIRRLIEQTLEDIELPDLEILTADNGEAGLQLIRQEKPGLVFLDVMMPKMNGFEVCNIIKHDPATAEIFVVMLTAKGQEFDRARGQEMGADIYMTKPFDPDELLKLAQVVLGS